MINPEPDKFVGICMGESEKQRTNTASPPPHLHKTKAVAGNLRNLRVFVKTQRHKQYLHVAVSLKAKVTVSVNVCIWAACLLQKEKNMITFSVLTDWRGGCWSTLVARPLYGRSVCHVVCLGVLLFAEPYFLGVSLELATAQCGRECHSVAVNSSVVTSALQKGIFQAFTLLR